jgi:hypothetical protein
MLTNYVNTRGSACMVPSLGYRVNVIRITSMKQKGQKKKNRWKRRERKIK